MIFLCPVFGQSSVFTYQPDASSEVRPHISPRPDLVIFPVRHADPKLVRDAVSSMYPLSLATVEPRSRTLMLWLSKPEKLGFQQMMRVLDTAIPQLKIEVKVIEVTTLYVDQYRHLLSGLESGFSIGYDFQAGRVTTPGNFESQLLNLAQQGRAKILSKPTISVQDNSAATIRVGDTVPYVTYHVLQGGTNTEVHFLDTGISLTLLPRVSSGNWIVVDINANISSVKMWRQFGNAQYPIVATRKTETKVTLESGKTLVMAGLLDNASRETTTGLPILSWLPGIGALFSSRDHEKSETDVIFLITPQILPKST